MSMELGVIEGFFGRPYDWDERADMVWALAPAGYSFYLYAPKADGYLRRRWREPYPDADLKALRTFAGTCREAGVRFGAPVLAGGHQLGRRLAIGRLRGHEIM